MISIKNLDLLCCKDDLTNIPDGKILINTINAYSYNNARKDSAFELALKNGDYLIPDGVSIVKACRWLRAKCLPKERIAGWDLFVYEMGRLNDSFSNDGAYWRTFNKERIKPKVMFMGSSQKVLDIIVQKATVLYPNLYVVTFSPPYKTEFSQEDNVAIINAINSADPDLLWIGMTAPKQEKWTYAHWAELDIHCHVGTIGAVFDFFAGTYKRAPLWWQKHGLEWLYRLMKEPRRMWRRYLLGNIEFMWYVLNEKIGQ